jgi:hypothetical protein
MNMAVASNQRGNGRIKLWLRVIPVVVLLLGLLAGFWRQLFVIDQTKMEVMEIKHNDETQNKDISDLQKNYIELNTTVKNIDKNTDRILQKLDRVR